MKKELSLFERYLFEAPGDTPPDIPEDAPEITPPTEEVPDDTPPDMDDAPDNNPPDLAFGDDEDSPVGGEGDIEENPGEEPPSGLDEKISTVMNMNLYQRFLSLLNNIENQIFMIKNNSDILYSISNNSLNILSSLRKLDENVRLYITHYFLKGNYSKNLLFFNKCLNLLKLLNDIFDKEIRRGVKNIE